MNEFVNLIRSYGIARLGVIVGVSLGVALALGLIVARIGEAPKAILYADLDLREAQEASTRLDQQGVDYDIRENGGRVTILTPRNDVARLKLALAGDGFTPNAGGVGYEIFDETDALGATSFQQDINRLRALEGELGRTISTISGVRSARVHLVLPERELFSRDKQRATASIVVDAPAGLEKKSVRAIVNLVASAAPDLSPANVTVLDASGDLLASGQNDNDPLSASGGVEERIAATETRIRRTVEDIVGRIVGTENLRVQVTADLDLNRVTETSNIIDPDSQTVLSSTTVEDNSNSRDPALTRGVTIANALPEADIVDAAGADATTSAASRIEETTNYEMTRTVRNAVREIGGVNRLSVAVALNMPTAPGADGALVAAPRSDEEMQRIEALVRSAIGYNAARGDQVEVVEMAFQQPESASAAAAPAQNARPQFSNEMLMRGAEIGSLALIALALVVFVLRPLMAGAPASSPAPSAATALDAAPAQTALPSPAAGQLDAKIDLAQVEGQVKASSLKKVAEVVKSHTDESSFILKSWIREAS